MDPFKPGAHANETFKSLELPSPEAFRGSTFCDCTFVQCRFHGFDFSGVDITDCIFDHCEFSLPKMTNCGLHGVTFKDSKLVGVDFSRCSSHFFTVSFRNCLIETCNFSSLKLNRTPFIASTIRECRFTGSNLMEADFENSSLEKTLFHDCDLREARFHAAKHYAIDPTANKVKDATFSLPEAVSLLTGLGIHLQ